MPPYEGVGAWRDDAAAAATVSTTATTTTSDDHLVLGRTGPLFLVDRRPAVTIGPLPAPQAVELCSAPPMGMSRSVEPVGSTRIAVAYGNSRRSRVHGIQSADAARPPVERQVHSGEPRGQAQQLCSRGLAGRQHLP